MTSDAIPIDPQEFPSGISASLITIHVWTAGLALYMYEYLLTLPLEVEVIWKSKPNLTIILFLINRYSFILTWSITVVFDSIYTNVTGCYITNVFATVFNVLGIISISGVFIFRTYAICGQNKWILGLLSLIFLSQLGLLILAQVYKARQVGIVLIPHIDAVGNCETLITQVTSVKIIAIEEILTVVFDATVFILTVSRTWTISRRAKATGVEAPLTELLLRDGSLYFGLLSVMLILEAITIFDMNLPTSFYVITELYYPLEVILANRLILNLRTHSQSNDLSNPNIKTDMFFRQAYGGSRNDGRFQSTIDSALGNIGAPLRVEDDMEDGDGVELQVPKGEREHGMENGMDPLSLEMIQIQSERGVANEEDISEVHV